MSKKILLSLDAWYPQVAGPNIVVTNYLKHLRKNNECHLLVPSYGKKMNKEATAKTGVDVQYVKSVNIFFGGYRNVIPFQDKDAVEIAKNADIYHGHSPFALSHFFAKKAKQYNAPSILTVHTKFKDDFLRCTHSRALTAFMMRRMMKVINETDYIWTVSDGAVEMLREYGYNGDVTVIRNGTDLTMPDNVQQLVDRVNQQYNLANEENVLLFVGRIVSTKNLPLVFRALQIVKQNGLPFKMLVVGGGESMDDYKQMIKNLGLSKNIIMVGPIYDREYLKAFYLRADLFVFPSEYDTASLCPIEAATFALPTLMVRGCPTAETIKEDFSGYTEVADAKMWAYKIMDILKNKQQLSTVSQNSRKFVYRSWEDVVREVEAEYDKILNIRKNK